MRAESTRASDRCNVSKDVFQAWLQEREIEDVEAFVPDMAGSARGKVVPADKFGSGKLKMPEAIFAQTISGDYVKDEQNVEDRDMLLTPDPTTLRPVEVRRVQSRTVAPPDAPVIKNKDTHRMSI